jgi:hypothetical protein
MATTRHKHGHVAKLRLARPWLPNVIFSEPWSIPLPVMAGDSAPPDVAARHTTGPASPQAWRLLPLLPLSTAVRDVRFVGLARRRWGEHWLRVFGRRRCSPSTREARAPARVARRSGARGPWLGCPVRRREGPDAASPVN